MMSKAGNREVIENTPSYKERKNLQSCMQMGTLTMDLQETVNQGMGWNQLKETWAMIHI